MSGKMPGAGGMPIPNKYDRSTLPSVLMGDSDEDLTPVKTSGGKREISVSEFEILAPSGKPKVLPVPSPLVNHSLTPKNPKLASKKLNARTNKGQGKGVFQEVLPKKKEKSGEEFGEERKRSSFSAALDLNPKADSKQERKEPKASRTVREEPKIAKVESVTFSELEAQIKNKEKTVSPPARDYVPSKKIKNDEGEDNVDLINQVVNFFEVYDSTAPKHLISSCINLIESDGIQAVEQFLLNKYGHSLFADNDLKGLTPSANYQPAPPISSSMRKLKSLGESEKQEEVPPAKVVSIEEVRAKIRHIVSKTLVEATTRDALKIELSLLFRLRDLVMSGKLRNGQTADVRSAKTAQEQSLDEICDWSFKYGTHSLSGKLEIFYLGSVESPSQPDSIYLQSLPKVPFHGSTSRDMFLKKLREIERRSVQAKELAAMAGKSLEMKPIAVQVDKDTELDHLEIAHLWLCVFNFYNSNNLSKGSLGGIVKQTENSVYYILQRGIQGFNKKLSEKYGDKLKTAFSLPDKLPNTEDLLLGKITSLYSDANKELKAEAEAKGKKFSKRSFSRLIDALNFKFQAHAKKKANEDSLRKTKQQKKNTPPKPRETQSSKKFTKSDKKTRVPQVSVFKKKLTKKEKEKLLHKKIKLFLLQSMKTAREKVDEETASLMKIYKLKGFRALSTRLKIYYGGNFEYIDAMAPEEVNDMLETILSQPEEESKKPKAIPSANNPQQAAQFLNIYKDLSFYRNPAAQIRFNKGP